MSKAKELLKRVRDTLHELKETPYDLYWDIQTALDQPEQDKQEPVGVVKTLGGYPDDSYHVVELTCRHRDLKHGDLLYTAPPKREPLSDETIADLWWNNYVGTADSVRNFARAIEKAHGIGGE
tara:strand:- start:1320 stop:1688 length:369 start_codon:yes stop_codon:yes gene_type:complete